jgi:hypothetical protein
MVEFSFANIITGFIAVFLLRKFHNSMWKKEEDAHYDRPLMMSDVVASTGGKPQFVARGNYAVKTF